MKTKRIALLGVSILATLTLVACSGGSTATSNGGVQSSAKDVSKTATQIVKTPLKLTMFAPASGTVSYSKMAMLNDYAKKTNVSFTYTTPPSADLGTKLNLALASGDAPDVIYASQISNSQAIQYGGSTLIDLKPYIDAGYMPNLEKILKKYPNVKKSITTPDGHIYTLPFLGNEYDLSNEAWANSTQLYQGSVWFNGEWLKKLGLAEPTTTDELYKVLTAFKNDDPNGNGKKDEIPLSTTSGANDGGGFPAVRTWIMNAFGVLSNQQQVDSKGKVTYGAIQPGYRDYLAYMNKLYKNGLLDPQTFSQSDDTKKAKAANNLLGAYTDWFSYFTSGKTPEQATSDPLTIPLRSPDSNKQQIIASDGVTTGAFAVTNKCSNVAAAARWVDYFYSEEGAQYLNVGPEQSAGGYWHWETNNAGEKVHVLNKGINPADSEQARSAITPDYGTMPPKVNVPSVAVLTSADQKLIDGKYSDQFSAWLQGQVDKNITPYKVVAWPSIYMSKDEQTQLGSTMQTDLLTYVLQSEAKFITGQTPLTDSKWNDYVKNLKSIGVDKYVKVQQEAYDTWKNTK